MMTTERFELHWGNRLNNQCDYFRKTNSCPSLIVRDHLKRHAYSKQEIVDVMNEQNETIIKNEEVFKKIEDRIIQLEKELNKSKDYFRPKDSVFNNPMSDVYDKERREELSALRWVLRLRSE